MILLNEPWSVTERALERRRRALAARRVLGFLLYTAAMLAIGLLFGVLCS